MDNIFATGIKTNDGLSMIPAISFITDNTTGIFLNSDNQNVKSLGLSANGRPVALFGSDQIQLLQGLTIAENAVNGAVLTSDSAGAANWRVNSQHGTFKWNSIYTNIDAATFNNEVNITFTNRLDNSAVALTKESDYVIDNFDLYIKNKTSLGFKIYSNSFMYKTLVIGSIGDYSIVRLTTGGIGICYYNIGIDRMQYIYSADSTNSMFSTPITIDNISAIGQVSMCIVGNYPAVTYIADNDDNDEWRYIIATDVNGTSWKPPVILATSTVDITFAPVSLFLRVVAGNPVVFLSNETGRAQMYRSKDTSGSNWNTVINISNLVNHQILDVLIINNKPAIIAKSNIVNNLYYVQSTDTTGVTWPIGATQIYKPNNTPLYTNDGKCCNTMGIVNGALTIIASEINSNILYTATANDINGASWGAYKYLAPTNTTNAFPRIFNNNNITYMLYNNTTGSPSEKKLIEFSKDGEAKITDNFIGGLNLCGDNQTIANKKDGNNIVVITSQKALSILKFYGNDFSINWSACS